MTHGPELAGDILSYYEQGREDDRLRTGGGRLELWRTQHILRRYLPPAPATVLDIGGGSGVHAEWLAEDGHDVHLIDPVPLHVEQASTLPGVRVSVGDARELDLPDQSADVALLLGPLYHLTDPADRLRAVREAARVARPGGIVAVAGISRFASMRDSLRKGWLDDQRWVGTVERTVATGRHRNESGHEQRFTTAYFHRADDLGSELMAAGLHDVEVIAVEGIGSFLDGLDEILDVPNTHDVLMRWIQMTEREPSLLGASGHLLAIGRR
ncbi:MAG TPA: class I SAM-dependent methyltransferase [Jiangellaceae bacterium]